MKQVTVKLVGYYKQIRICYTVKNQHSLIAMIYISGNNHTGSVVPTRNKIAKNCVIKKIKGHIFNKLSQKIK